MRLERFTKVVIVAAAVACSAFAQSDQARITGTVIDASGAVIPNATITISSQKGGLERTVKSNEAGRFAIVSLPPAQYKLIGKADGLGPAEFTDITLTAGQERSLNIILQPQSVATEVNVSGGELVVIDTSSARVGANVNEREVGTLPLNGRQLSQLYLLVPGAQTAGGGSYDNIRFSGRANQQNAVRFDGVEASSIVDASPGNLNGESSTGFRLQSSIENVQEFRVESSNYTAEFGTGTGGQISVVTKSGSNQLRGSVFEYLRNDAMDARNFFDGTTKSPLRLNQFGGSLGGRVIRYKLFFFASYEGLRQNAGFNIIETVPSLAARGRAVASIRPVLDAYPIGQSASVNPDLDIARLNATSRITEDYGSLRLDYRVNDRHSIVARYFRDEGEAISPLNTAGSFSQTRATPQNALVSFQSIVTPTVINEFKAGFNGQKTRINGVAPTVNGIDFTPISIDFSGSAAIPGIGGQGASAGASRLGGLIRSNSTQNGRGQPYTSYTMSFVNSLSLLKGNHNLKFGGEFRPIHISTDRLGGTTYTFSNLNALLANMPSQVQFLGDVSAPSPFNGGATGSRNASQSYYIGYAQDEWKIRPNFTMNYGVRYEYYSVLREDRNLDVVFNTVTGAIMPSDTPFYHSKKTNFAPRLSFTFAPTRLNSNTVFRIGAGYNFGPGQTEDQIQPIESDRVSRTLSGVAYPINPAAIIAGYDINDPNLGYQPRAYAPGYTLPEKILSYTASVHQQLPFNTILSVAYVGSQGRNLFLRSWTNQIVSVGTNPTTGAAIEVKQFGNRFAQIDYKTSGGTDHYDSLQTTLNRRFSKGFTMGAQWTYGHSIGNTGGSNEAQTANNPNDFSAERGNNAFDVRHSANVSAMYELPFGKNSKGLAKSVLGGWEVGGVMNARTGLPIDVKITRPDSVYRDTRTGAIVNAPILVDGKPVTVAVANVVGGGSFRNSRRPDVVAGVNPFLHTGDRRFILNPAAFTTPAPGTYGNLGRWALHGPGLAQFDLTLHKKIAIHEKHNLEFRAELYNVFNRANFANPPAALNNSLGTGMNQLQPGIPFTPAAAGGAFGVANGTVERTVGLGGNRQVQLSLRYSF